MKLEEFIEKLKTNLLVKRQDIFKEELEYCRIEEEGCYDCIDYDNALKKTNEKFEEYLADLYFDIELKEF